MKYILALLLLSSCASKQPTPNAQWHKARAAMWCKHSGKQDPKTIRHVKDCE